MKFSEMIDLDIGYYLNSNDDLFGLSESEAKNHYLAFGYFEGRASSENALREHFVKQFQLGRCLEIGPFANPVLQGDNVEYFDVLSSEQLEKRAETLGISPQTVPFIKYVSPEGDLSIVTDTFDTVFSSHNIEHQPDLISHLNQVYELLENSGNYALIVPDFRFCFDADLPQSTISDVLNAFYAKRTRHTVGSVIEHRALTTHNDAIQHWEESNTLKTYRPLDIQRVRAAILEYENAEGNYIDVHAWKFEPFSFADTVNALIKLELIKFSSVTCNGPVRGCNEFTVTLHK